MIKLEKFEKTAVLELNGAKNNAINLNFINRISSHLQDIKNDPLFRSVILTNGKNKFFSSGLDLMRLLKLKKEKLRLVIQGFNNLCLLIYSYPKPVVAAIGGHALGEGALLAFCCDYRFLEKGKTLMGMNQIKLGLPILYPADHIIYQKFGEKTTRTLIDSGEYYPPENMMIWGLVDEVCENDEVLLKSIDKCRELNKLPAGSYRTIKTNRAENLLDGINSKFEKREVQFLDCWFSAPTQKLLKKAGEKFK